jgi:hypothetical protein
MEMQHGWRWCNRCYGLAYSGFGDGVCLDRNAHDFSGSGEYLVPIGATPEGAQPGWRWCNRCQCLAYGALDAGACYADATHDLGDSSEYGLPLDNVPAGAQEGWRWCSRCQCLVFVGGPDRGTCPDGTDHDTGTSAAYSVPTPASLPAVVNVSPTITVREAGWITVEGEGFSPGGPVHIRFLVTPRFVDATTTANESGRIQHTEDGRRTVDQGTCMVFARDESTGRWTVDKTVAFHPKRLPLDSVLIDHVVAEPADG